MNSFSRSWALVFLCLAACASQKIDDAPVLTPELLSRSKTPAHKLQQGRALYLAHCGRCHASMLPTNIREEDWHVVVPGMAWNAGLSAAEEQALRAYILAVLP